MLSHIVRPDKHAFGRSLLASLRPMSQDSVGDVLNEGGLSELRGVSASSIDHVMVDGEGRLVALFLLRDFVRYGVCSLFGVRCE